MEDNSLEAASVADLSEEDVTAEGALSVAEGAGAGDLALGVGELEFSYHSPSRVDLSPFAGDEVSLGVEANYSVGPTVSLSDADGPLLYATADDDGTRLFGRTVWKAGEVIGKGELPEPYVGETLSVRFVEVLVSGDDGEQVLLPGEPTAIVLDGLSYRFTVTTAYEADNPSGSKCGAPDVIAVELVRTDDVPNETLTRSAEFDAPIGSCG